MTNHTIHFSETLVKTAIIHERRYLKDIMYLISATSGSGSSRTKTLGYGLDCPGSISGIGRVEIFIHPFVSRLVMGSTQSPENEYRGYPGSIDVRA